MPNIPGATNVLPGTFSQDTTTARGVAIGGGQRVAAIIGEGSASEVLIATAQGRGRDGLAPDYSGTNGADGRHFSILSAPLVSNRTALYRNGKLLNGVEMLIDDSAFSHKYDYRLDPATGQVEMQKAYIVDQGGSFYTPYTPLGNNAGAGAIEDLSLEDENATPETWSIRCVSVQRDSSGSPIPGTASFLAFGSVSGAKLDANGNPVVWVADGYAVSNGILKFKITEDKVLNVTTAPFYEGDGFIIKVASGVLVRNDSLVASFIPANNLNVPNLYQSMSDVVKNHGNVSVDNNLSLGCQLAFANGAPFVMTVQAAPPVPRRKSFVLTKNVQASSTDDDDFIFPLPLGVTPDSDSNIHFFVQNNSTKVETQVLPNKFDFYTLDTAGYPTTHEFITDAVPAPGGHQYFYTVKQSLATLVTGFDGYIGRVASNTTVGVFSSSVKYDSTYVGKELKIIDSVNTSNVGVYTVTSVSNGKLYVTHTGLSDFVSESSVAFEVQNNGVTVNLGAGTDGVLVAILGSSTATLSSTAVNFANISNITTLKLQINSSVDNYGSYDIIGYDSLTNTLTLRKALVTESGMRFEVLDPLTVSNYIVINNTVVPNGFGLRVSLIDIKDAPFYDSGWLAALESLEAVECDIVVPLPKQTISNILQNTLNHCLSMSQLRVRKERVMFTGAINGLKPEHVTGSRLAAVEDIGLLEGIQGDSVTEVLSGNIEDLADYSVPAAFGETHRAVYCYPDQIIVGAGTENVLVDGFYMAAAAAGYLSGTNRIEMPLTNKVLAGFTIPRSRTFRPATLEALVAAGCTVLTPVQGGGKVVWGLTTTQSGYAEEQEISIVFIRDRVAKLLRAGFNNFIGQPESETTQADMMSRAVILLNALVGQKLITKYRGLSVKRDELEPRQWNVNVEIQPTYPINWVFVRFQTGLIA